MWHIHRCASNTSTKVKLKGPIKHVESSTAQTFCVHTVGCAWLPWSCEFHPWCNGTVLTQMLPSVRLQAMQQGQQPPGMMMPQGNIGLQARVWDMKIYACATSEGQFCVRGIVLGQACRCSTLGHDNIPPCAEFHASHAFHVHCRAQYALATQLPFMMYPAHALLCSRLPYCAV